MHGQAGRAQRVFLGLLVGGGNGFAQHLAGAHGAGQGGEHAGRRPRANQQRAAALQQRQAQAIDGGRQPGTAMRPDAGKSPGAGSLGVRQAQHGQKLARALGQGCVQG